MAQTDRCVVRNQAYQKKEFSIRERHNERKNESYYNADIQPDRKHLNVHFKQSSQTYAENFDNLLAAGKISTRGQKANANVFDELVFDVNSEYFDRNGGYEYAKSFFEAAYQLAIKEAGGEEYILSAVMHADERNKALSEKLGYDVYHYHLHVVYIPVVDKEVRWTKRCRDPALVGTVKEVIKQVSHSKKWPRYKENGHWVNSYSLLQDRFFEHMQAAGFTGFQRGERGSTTEHLAVLDYKIQQDQTRANILSQLVIKQETTAAALDLAIQSKEQIAARLDEKAEVQKKQLHQLNNQTTVAKQAAATFADIDRMGNKHTITGNASLSPADWQTVSALAKEGVKSRGIIAELKKKLTALMHKITELEKRLKQYEGLGITDTMQYYQARQRAPRRMANTIADIMRQPPEQEQRSAPEPKRSIGLDI
ncbi:MAG: plasmid recombination protein [Firmicutes bacterium]|nr:plasmid recombination protein [Bacillota bacterium]